MQAISSLKQSRTDLSLDHRPHLIAALCTQAHQRRHLPGGSVALNLVEVAAEQDAGCGQADQQGRQRQLRPQTGVLQQPR